MAALALSKQAVGHLRLSPRLKIVSKNNPNCRAGADKASVLVKSDFCQRQFGFTGTLYRLEAGVRVWRQGRGRAGGRGGGFCKMVGTSLGVATGDNYHPKVNRSSCKTLQTSYFCSSQAVSARLSSVFTENLASAEKTSNKKSEHVVFFSKDAFIKESTTCASRPLLEK